MLASVKGSAGIILRDTSDVLTVISFTVDRRRISSIVTVRNPEKRSSVT